MKSLLKPVLNFSNISENVRAGAEFTHLFLQSKAYKLEEYDTSVLN